MLNIDLSGKNKYYTLYAGIREEILSGKIKAGERLPSKRALAEELGVSVVTVQLAYEQLLAEGYISSKERSGYFAERVEAPSRSRGTPDYGRVRVKPTAQYTVDFTRGGIPAELFPFSVWAKLMRYVLADCGEHLLERVPCGGDYELKCAISRYLYRARGIVADPANLVIGAGAEHLYGVIVQLLGRDKVYAVENPGYGKIYSTYTLNGATALPVRVGDTGICVDEAIKSGAHAVHLSPSHQFPTGAVMPVSERAKLIRLATQSGAYIIEDDYDSEFRLAGKPIQSMYGLAPDRVIYMNTFSKSLAPSMRLGYMVLPPELAARYADMFGGSANLVPLFEQKTLAAMLENGHFERHISRLKNYYRGIRAQLSEKLGGLGELIDTGSGLHMILKFKGLADEEIKARALAAGIKLKCLTDYLLTPLDGYEGCAVINYSGITADNLPALDAF